MRKLYVEGGGTSKSLRTSCREGFRRFLEKAGLRGRMPRIVACGSRRQAYDDFVTAQRAGDGLALLLVDAEAPVEARGPWEHLERCDRWTRPENVRDEHCHLMVQAMESWFLAGKSSLIAWYGEGFQESALPANPRVEDIPKADVLDGLSRATRATQKGPYEKGRHGFEILARLDPERVKSAAPYARRFLDFLRAG